MRNISYLFFSILILWSCSNQQKADTIVYNAVVYTVDEDFSTAEAFAIKDGKFLEISSSEEILAKYKATETLDAEGKAIFPGFYDSHAHFLGLASFLDEVDLNGSKSFEEVINRLKEYEAKNPDKEWITGGGWDQNLWPDKQFPTKILLDEAFPDKAIYLSRVDYHAAVVNSKALEISGIDKIQEIPGGLMGGSNGIPDGLLIDNAMDLVNPPGPDAEEYEKLALNAQEALFSVGLTSINDAGVSVRGTDLLKSIYQKGKMKLRNYVMVSASPESVDEYKKRGTYSSDRLEIKSFKIVGDGALGSRGACLLENYSDDSHTKGFLLHSPEELEHIVSELEDSPFQLNTHAIGDSANRIMLDLYGNYLKDGASRRWRIEHAQIIHPDDFKKFSQYHIIPSIQPTHATSDMRWAPDRLGKERMKGAYAYQQLLNEYGKVALGSDFPVEHYNPMYGFHSAVARQDANNRPEGGFQMENALNREDAVRGMTIWSAYAAFQEKQRGSIEKGKDADFVIMEDDLMTAPFEKLRNIKPLRTVIAGETVFDASKGNGKLKMEN